MVIKMDSKMPHKWQQIVVANLRRVNVIVASRQIGKSTLVAKLAQAIVHNLNIENPRISISCPELKQIFRLYRKSLTDAFGKFKGFKYDSDKVSLISFHRPEDGALCEIHLFGGISNPNAVRGVTNVHLNVLDEFADLPEDYLGASKPTTDNVNGITIVTGTVKPNHYFRLFNYAKNSFINNPNGLYYACNFKLTDPIVVGDARTKKEIEDIQEGSKYSENAWNMYLQEYENEWFAHVKGAVYKKDVETARANNQFGNFPISRYLSIDIFWDLGKGVTGIWFLQTQGTTRRLVKYKEWHDGNLEDICLDLNKWQSDNGYFINKSFYPYDIVNRDYSAKLNRFTMVRNTLKCNHHIPMKKSKAIDDRVQAGKEFLKYVYFDEHNTEFGVRCLEMYSRKVDKLSGTAKAAYSDDEYTHGADSFGLCAEAWKLDQLSKETDVNANRRLPSWMKPPKPPRRVRMINSIKFSR